MLLLAKILDFFAHFFEADLCLRNDAAKVPVVLSYVAGGSCSEGMSMPQPRQYTLLGVRHEQMAPTKIDALHAVDV